MPRTAVFYDTEYTTWEGALAARWSAPGQHRELVQIGALRFDLENFTVLQTFDILVRPTVNPVLSDYFIRLTGITNEEVAGNGLPFASALEEFRDFLGGMPAASYGSDDAVVRENQRLNGMAEDFTSLNIGAWFFEHGAAHGIKKGVNSGSLAKMVGTAVEGPREHNALYDARSIAAAYAFLRGRGAAEFFT